MKTPSIQLNPVCPQNHRPTFVVVFFVVSYSSSLAPLPLLSLYRTTVQCAPSPPQLTSPSHHFLDLYFQFLISQRPCSTHAQNKKKINYLCFTVLFVLCGGGVGANYALSNDMACFRTHSIFLCGAGEGWRRSVGPIVREMRQCYTELSRI